MPAQEIHPQQSKIPHETPMLNQNKLVHSRYFFPVLAGVVSLLIVSVAFVFYNVGKKSTTDTANQNGTETIEFQANNFESEITPATATAEATPSDTTPTTTQILLADPELDGYVASDGVGNSQKQILVGRNVDSVTRGLVSFDLSKLPTGISVKAAQLRLYQSNTIGTPYTVVGELRIDHLTYGNNIDSEDYSHPALLGNIATLSISKQIGWKEADVIASVRDDIANARTRSQYRIHFARETTGGDKRGDYAEFTSADGKTSNQPQLVVEYY